MSFGRCSLRIEKAWEERAVRTRAVVAGLEQALEEEVRFDHRVAPAHSTDPRLLNPV